MFSLMRWHLGRDMWEMREGAEGADNGYQYKTLRGFCDCLDMGNWAWKRNLEWHSHSRFGWLYRLLIINQVENKEEEKPMDDGVRRRG